MKTGQGQGDGSVKRGSDADSGVPTISSLLQRKNHEDNSKLTKESDTRGANEPTKATLAETTRDKDTSYSSDDASMSIEEVLPQSSPLFKIYILLQASFS